MFNKETAAALGYRLERAWKKANKNYRIDDDFDYIDYSEYRCKCTCGQSITNAFEVIHIKTGDLMTLGINCLEKVLDSEAVRKARQQQKQYKYEQQRRKDAKSQHRREEYQKFLKEEQRLAWVKAESRDLCKESHFDDLVKHYVYNIATVLESFNPQKAGLTDYPLHRVIEVVKDTKLNSYLIAKQKFGTTVEQWCEEVAGQITRISMEDFNYTDEHYELVRQAADVTPQSDEANLLELFM